MKSKLKPIAKHCKAAVAYICMLCLMVLPTISFGQPAPPGPGGGNPDSPLGVPFDDNMNMILLAVGIVFAVVTLKKMQKQRAMVNTVS
jgi:hypothetical protein